MDEPFEVDAGPAHDEEKPEATSEKKAPMPWQDLPEPLKVEVLTTSAMPLKVEGFTSSAVPDADRAAATFAAGSKKGLKLIIVNDMILTPSDHFDFDEI